IGDAPLDLGDACQGAVPASLELARDEAVLRVGGVVLAGRPISGVTHRLEVTQQGVPRLVAPRGGLGLGRERRRGGGGPDDGEQGRLDRVVDAQPAEADAARLPVVEPPAPADVAGMSCLAPVY